MTERTLAVNGPSTKEPFGSWFRYPAGFSNEALMLCFSVVQIGSNKTYMDPFAGASTVGVKIVESGGVYRGIEAHPVVSELSNLKFLRLENIKDLREYAEDIIDIDCFVNLENEHSLVRRCFDEETLKILCSIRDNNAINFDNPFHLYLKWALIATLRDVSSVKVGWPYQQPSKSRVPKFKFVKKRILDRIGRMIEDIENSRHNIDAMVLNGDSRSDHAWESLLDCKVDGFITSPPYLNNFDYADATRLEMYFLKYTDSWRGLTEKVRHGMISASTQQTNKGKTGLAEARLKDFSEAYTEIAQLHDLLSEKRESKKREGKGRTKEYDSLILEYFSDMSFVIQNMTNFAKRKANIAMVVGDSAPYGIYVDTPRILGIIGESLGLEIVKDMPIRKRGQKWKSLSIRHSVDLSERVLVLRKP